MIHNNVSAHVNAIGFIRIRISPRSVKQATEHAIWPPRRPVASNRNFGVEDVGCLLGKTRMERTRSSCASLLWPGLTGVLDGAVLQIPEIDRPNFLQGRSKVVEDDGIAKTFENKRKLVHYQSG